jgi:parallel beta-helix repeat protein
MCDEGVRLSQSPNCALTNNKFNSIIGAISGLSLDQSPSCVLEGNQFTNCTGGISISESGLSRLRSNVVAQLNGLSVGGSAFGVVGYKPEGFYLDIDTSNTIEGKPIYYLRNLNGVTVDPLTYSNAGYLALVECSNLKVEGFSLSGCSQGILVAATNGTEIKNNIIAHSGDGIGLACYSDGNLIFDNTFESNQNSIRSYYCFDNQIIGNNMSSSGTLWIDNSAGYMIFGNNMGGFKFVQADNITTFHNNFLITSYYLGTQDALGTQYPTGGNYHHDYTGIDVKSGISQGVDGPDGIGDTAYYSDFYPLMAPVSVYQATTAEGQNVYVQVESNSTITDFKVDLENGLVSFKAGGEVGSFGFARVEIPKSVSQKSWGGNFQIVVNGRSNPFTLMSDAQNDYAYLSYTNGNSSQDFGNANVGGFPLLIIAIIVVFVVVILVAILVRAKILGR